MVVSSKILWKIHTKNGVSNYTHISPLKEWTSFNEAPCMRFNKIRSLWRNTHALAVTKCYRNYNRTYGTVKAHPSNAVESDNLGFCVHTEPSHNNTHSDTDTNTHDVFKCMDHLHTHQHINTSTHIHNDTLVRWVLVFYRYGWRVFVIL